jgi:general stress protein 26
MPDQSEKLNTTPVRNFLSEVILARLATTNPSNHQPHVVPVWFEWDGESIWISAFRSTRKLREVEKNPRVSIVVDTDERGGAARGVLFEGQAELVTDSQIIISRSTSIYTRYLGEQGVLDPAPQSWIIDPENTLIKLKPEKVYVWGL